MIICNTCDITVITPWCEKNCSNSKLIIDAAKAKTQQEQSRMMALDQEQKVLKSLKSLKPTKSKKITCHETGSTYNSAKEVAELYKVSETAIYTAIRNGNKCAAYHWQWAGEELKSYTRQPNGRIPNKVRCLKTKKIHTDAKEAAFVNKVSLDKIRQHCLKNVLAPEFEYVFEVKGK